MFLFVWGIIIGYFLFRVFHDDNKTIENDSEVIQEINSIHESGSKSYKTSALDDGKVYEVIERNRYPVLKPQSEPVPYKAPPKPNPIPDISNYKIVVGKPPSSSVTASSYTSNELTDFLIEEKRREYQLPYGEVDMPEQETAAIVAIILYFLEKEPKIGITKLESYIIMLDNMCLENTGKRLFHYRLTYGPHGYYIQNFRAFLDFIEDKKILSKRREYFTRKKYRIDFTPHQYVSDEIFPKMLLSWMKIIVSIWKGAGADHTKRDMQRQLTPAAIEAFMSIQSLN